MANKTAFSRRGLPYGSAVDVGALSDVAAVSDLVVSVLVGAQPLAANANYFVQNASTNHVIGPLGRAGIITALAISSARLASLGTGSYSIYAATTDGTTMTLLTNTLDCETGTANVARSFTIAGTNRALAATDVLFLRCTADNTAITTDLSTVKVLVGIVPTDTAPTRGGSTWGT